MFSIRGNSYIKHIPGAYSMSIIWALDSIENKHSLYLVEYCMKNATNFEKKKMLPLTK